MRAALVTNTTREQLARYLPSNYKIRLQVPEGILIAGEDVAGWTLDGYVIPRLASGLIWAHEVDPDTGREST